MSFARCWTTAVVVLSIGLIGTVESTTSRAAEEPQTSGLSFLSAWEPGPNPINVKVWIDREPHQPYREGDRLIINLHADRDCYIAMIAASSDGNVAVLVPDGEEGSGKISKGKIYTFFGADSEIRLLVGKRVAKSELAFLVSSTPLSLTSLQGSIEPEGTAVLIKSVKGMNALEEEIDAMAQSDGFNRVLFPLTGPDGKNFEINVTKSSEKETPGGARGLPSLVESKPPVPGGGIQGAKTKLPKKDGR